MGAGMGAGGAATATPAMVRQPQLVLLQQRLAEKVSRRLFLRPSPLPTYVIPLEFW